ncbi:restriction endonuclease [Maridesulfovibrio sp.]|uniref:restriction endonuclease n=1 Tax=Maridesulfovibrio sp. TaxID=2795000 RepID=UPI002A18C40A|nr:restriction endonuclease [Maridesulfovibrio sp.]
MKIWQAVKKVLEEAYAPLTYVEVYEDIVKKGYYQFKAKNPKHVVHSEIRRRCNNLDFASAKSPKFFTRNPDGKYTLIGFQATNAPNPLAEEENEHFRLEHRLENAHEKYIASFKKVLLEELKNLTPYEFEVFSKNLLKSYGVKELMVTSPSRDGGIDGEGILKAGLSKLCVAFQCKRWKGGKVGRGEVDKFRGAIQGKFDQGIFFTTSTFTSGAKAVSTRVGAVPIILVNGDGIVDIMLEKRCGVQQELFAKYSIELDRMLVDDG